MVNFNIKTEYPALKRTLKRMQTGQDLREGMRDAADFFRDKVAEYPAERHGKAIWSDDPEKRKRQIRGFFYYLKKGVIKVPYPRTGDHGKKWIVRPIGNGTTWEVTNRSPKAGLMQGMKRTRYHTLTGWKRPREVYKANEAAIKWRIGRGVNKMIRNS